MGVLLYRVYPCQFCSSEWSLGLLEDRHYRDWSPYIGIAVLLDIGSLFDDVSYLPQLHS